MLKKERVKKDRANRSGYIYTFWRKNETNRNVELQRLNIQYRICQF
jgi:hypothetical protein